MVDTRAQPIRPLIHVCTAADLSHWAGMRVEPWPDGDYGEHERFDAAALKDSQRLVALLAPSLQREPNGLAEASLRSDGVNWTSTSHVEWPSCEGACKCETRPPIKEGCGEARCLASARLRQSLLTNWVGN